VRSNCVAWALRTWCREGGHLTVCRSKYGWWWHVGILQNGVQRSYVPADPVSLATLTGWKRILRWLPVHIFVFRGHVLEGDYLNPAACPVPRRASLELPMEEVRVNATITFDVKTTTGAKFCDGVFNYYGVGMSRLVATQQNIAQAVAGAAQAEAATL
jgi:hypothetical protein